VPRRFRSNEVKQPVTIERDTLGIPRIVAGSQGDAMFGLGYATAQDRLFQMDLIRRSALGRLSEIAGPSMLASDRLMRTIGIHRVVRDVVHCQSATGQAALRAYAAGVNAWIDRGHVPLGCRLLRYRPDPWRPEDSVAILRLLGWSLSDFHGYELVAALLRTLIGDEWTDAIFAGRTPESPLVVREGSLVSGPLRPTSQPRVFPKHGASNAWAVAGRRSVTGFPLLANDPHLTYTNPSVWHEASLEAPGLRVSGMTMAGIPGILIGRTPAFGWGFTATMLGQSFLYRERLNADESATTTNGRVEPLVSRLEEIGVNGGAVERFTVRSTPRGPLLSDIEPAGLNEPYSMYWTGSEPGWEVDGVLALNRATSIDDALASRGLLTVPAVNMAAADTGGSIASITLGRIADREPRAGLLDPEAFPPTYIPPAELPVERDPERGWIAHANNPIVGEDYPYLLHGFYEPKFRAGRIGQVLDSRERHSMADMRALQTDICSRHAAELTPVLRDLVGRAMPVWAREDLERWDYVASPDSRATLLFQAFYHAWVRRSLSARLSSDMVDRLLELLPVGDIPRGFCDRLLTGAVSEWITDEERLTLARSAFEDALAWIGERLGSDPATWTWGQVHTVTFVHPLGQPGSPLRQIVNVGPAPLGGDRTTVWPSGWEARDPFVVTGGPSMRFITDMRRRGLSWATNTLGEAGNPLSRHARDQFPDFLHGRTHRMVNPDRRRSVTIYPRSAQPD
jgi:penicillin amidase